MSLFSRARRAAVAVGLSLLLPALGSAQEFPSRPIQIVTAVPAGSANDILARQIAEKLQPRIGGTVIVVDKPGAGSLLATDFVAKSAPDGYTLFLGNSALAFVPFLYAKLPFDPQADLAAVVKVAEAPYLVVVNNDLGVKSMQELFALAKAKPRSINFASGGIGSATHMACELLARRAGVELTHIPYANTAMIPTDLQSNAVQMFCCPPSSILPMLKRGRVSVIGVSAPANMTEPISAPSVKQATGVDFIVSQWYGLFAPKNTPRAVLQKLTTAMEAVLGDPEFRGRLREGGLESHPLYLTAFDDFLKKEFEMWGPVVKGAGIKLD